MCLSEVSDIETSVWLKYKDRGLVVWGIAGDNDAKETVETFAAQMGVTFPILYDEDKKVQTDFYSLELAISSVYPSDWVVGTTGELVYINNEFDAEEMLDVIESELAKMEQAAAESSN